MNLKDLLYIAPEIEGAVHAGSPVVALACAELCARAPGPEQAAHAAACAVRTVRAAGAAGAVTAVVDGVLRVGLSPGELERLFQKGAGPVCRSQLPVRAAAGGTGACDVSAALILAVLAGIPVVAAGSFGAPHCRGAAEACTPAADADARALAELCAAVVCADGAASSRDAGLLSAGGVPVLSLETDMPAGACSAAGQVSPAFAARTARTKWDLGLPGGVLLCAQRMGDEDALICAARAAASVSFALSAL